MISVTVLTKNCQETLGTTLKSLQKFPEVLIYDSGSTDATLQIAQKFSNVKIINGQFNGFGPTHNTASSLASHDWILSIDSDEVLTPELADEILNLKLDPSRSYQIDRKNYFNGKWVRWCGGWHPDPVVRLYHRKSTRFTDDAVHEKVIVEDLHLTPLSAPLLHTPYRSMGDFLSKMQTYSELFAQQNKGKKHSSMGKAVLHGWFAFLKSYLLKKGFLGGKEGFIISAYNGHTAFYKYLKLMEANANFSNCFYVNKTAFLLKSMLFIAIFFGVERFCHKQTNGFQMHKIASVHDAESCDQIYSLSSEAQAELRATFSQPFYFLGSGGQCYAFLSEDGKTVLKFFKNHHIRLWKFLSRISLPAGLDGYRQHILHKYLHQSPAIFESCKISYLEFKEHTGLLYLHLNKTDYFKKTLTIIDKLGIAHQIDLDASDFALQKKAEFTNPKLKKLIKQKKLDEAKQCIASIVDLIAERCRKGIRDRDQNIRRNFGFIGNQAIEIDLGSYTKDESLKSPEVFRTELLDKTEKFKQWLGRRNPELSLFLTERVNQILELK